MRFAIVESWKERVGGWNNRLAIRAAVSERRLQVGVRLILDQKKDGNVTVETSGNKIKNKYF